MSVVPSAVVIGGDKLKYLLTLRTAERAAYKHWLEQPAGEDDPLIRDILASARADLCAYVAKLLETNT